MNAEFLEKKLAFELDPEQLGYIKPFKTRKNLCAESFIGATMTIELNGGKGECSITGAIEENGNIVFSEALGNGEISCSYDPTTGIVTGQIGLD